MDVWRGAVRRFLNPPSPHRHSEEDYELLFPSYRNDSQILPNDSTHNRHHHHTITADIPAPSPSPTTDATRPAYALHTPSPSSLASLSPKNAPSAASSPFVAGVLIILWGSIPPSYDDIRGFERRLPQHDLSLPFPEGEDGLYLRFPGRLWGHGLNNILQET